MPHTLEQLEVEKKRRALIAEKERRQQFGTATLEPPAQIDMQIADPNDAYIGMSDPNEIRKRAKEVFDISIELETPPEEIEINYENLTKKAQKLIPGTMRFGAGEPMTIRAAPERTKWQKFKNFFVSERRPLPPDADRMEKVSRAFDIAVGSPLRVFLKFGKGMTLNTPDLMWAAIKRITPEDMWDDEVKNMTLDEAMDWAGGYDPSGFQKTVGEMAEFIGRLKTVAPIAQRLGIIGNTPKDISVLDKAFETAKLFGTSAIAEQIAKGASDVIDPTEAEFGFEGPKAVLRDMAIGAIFSFIHSGAKGLWSKLTPSEHSRALKMLGLKKGATQEEITRAANNFARKYHPDKAKGYVDEFKKVIKARDLLRQGEAQDIVYRGQKVTIKPKVLTGKVGAEKAVTKPSIQKPPEAAGEGVTEAEQFGIKQLQKSKSLKGITDSEALNIIRAKDKENAVKDILRNRGIDVDKVDIPKYDIRGTLTGDEEARPTIKGKKPSHQEAINLAVEEAMADVTDVIDVQMPQLTPTPEAKQPWEMTREELANQDREWYSGKQHLIPKAKFQEIFFERNYVKKKGKYYNILANGDIGGEVSQTLIERQRKEQDESHRYFVKKALSEGKPVPPEVLAEYPELKPAAKAQKPEAPKKPGHPAMATGRDLGLQMEPATKKPISEREIIDHFERALKVPIRGKATHKMRIYSGWYAIRAKGIRMKVLRTLDTVAHEVGHHIDHWTNIRTKTPKGRYSVPPGTAAELVKLGKALYGDRKPPGGYKSEGVAEFVRMYLFGEDVEAAAPNFNKFFNEQYLPNNKEVAAALTKAKAQITRWQQQGARARIRSQRYTGPVKGTVKERIEKFLQRIETDWRDELSPLRRGMKKAGTPSLAEERVESKLSPTQDPYFLATVFADKAGAKARFFALEGTTDMAGNQTGKSLMEVLKPVAGDIERFVDWAQAAKGLQLRKYGIDVGIDVKDMQYIYDKDKNPTYEQALKEWTQWSTAGLDYMVEAGAMPAKLRNKIREKHPVYIPFTRVFKEGEIRRRGGTGKGIAKTGKPVHAIKGPGSSSGTLDPIMASLQQIERQISISHKVMVAKALANLSNKEGIAGLIWRVPPPQQATQFSAEQIKKDVVRLAKEHLGLELDGIPSGYLEDWDELLTVFSNAPQYKGKDNIVAIRDAEGKPTFYELSPELFSIVEGLDQYRLPPFVDVILGMPTRAGRLGATGLNASFGLIRNIWRDMSTFTVLAKHAKAGPVSATKGLTKDVITQISDIADHVGIKNIPKYEDVQKFRALGGEMSVQIMHDQRGQKYLRESVLASNGKRYIFHTFKHPIDAMKHLFGVPEAGTRIGEFGPALKYAEKKWGKNSKEAAFYALYMGQDVTTNFTRHGRISKVVNQMTMFFNAGIQGPDKIYRTFKARPLRTSLTAIGALTIPAVYLWKRNRDKEWYKNMPAHEKYGYQHFEMPDGTITRFPVAFELGHIFQSLPVAHLDALYKSNPEEIKTAVDKMLQDLNPIDWPTVIRPIMELKSNEDFAGRPIVPERVEGKLAEDQVKERTTALMRLIGEKLNFSPAQIEHLVNSYTGGAYGRVAWLLEPKESEQSKSDIPIVGTLFLRDSYAPKAQIEEYYERLEKLERQYQSDKITSKEILERTKYNRAGSELTDIWQKLRDETTLKGREKLYGQAKKIIEQAKRPMTKSEIKEELRDNTHSRSGFRKDKTFYRIGEAHKGKERYVDALKKEL